MTDKIQARLLRLAALFLTLYALAITLSPVVRLRTWPVDLDWTHWIGLAVWMLTIAILHRQTAISLPDRDPFLLPAGGLLTGWGIMTQYRLDTTLGLRQSAWLLVSAILLLLILRRNPSLTILRRYKYLILTAGLVLTGLTFVFGTNPLGYGPRLWLGCCGIYLQPSEPLKLFFIIYLSAYMADQQFFLKTVTSQPGTKPARQLADLVPILAPSVFMTGLALALIFIQRDLGTASIFIFLFTSIVYLTVHSFWVLALSVISLVSSALFGYFMFDVIRLRVDSWLNPWLEPSGRSFQIVQSLLATANGGLLGRGPGLGSPSLVPIAHSDFIFAAISEEMGLLGGVGLIALIALVAHRGMIAAFGSSDHFQRFLAVGLTAYLAGQSILILGGNLRVLPLTGVTLPFVSYGGSSLVTSSLALLILLMISNPVELPTRRPFPSRPYRSLHALLLGGLAAVSLALGWWSIYRGPDLLTRTDNARRTIADRFVKRGSVFDRQGEPLAVTQGGSGAYERNYVYPDLGTTVGYTHPVYGQSGLEAALDPWLRGLEGYPDLVLWWEWIRYGRPPPGLDIRLTLDLHYQQIADQMLADQAGAVVVMNAANGDLLALASQPGFDPNLLDQEWSDLVQDPAAPFFNRATTGRYPAGAVLTPLLLAKAFEQNTEIPPAPGPGYELEPGQMECAYPLSNEEQSQLEWQAKAGCPGLTAALGKKIGAPELLAFFHSLGLYQSLEIGLQTWTNPAPQAIQDAGLAALGVEPNLMLSPLQAAVAAAPLSAAGNLPSPQIALTWNNPDQGWISFQRETTARQVLVPNSAELASQVLRFENTLYWQSVSTSANPGSDRPAFTWFLGGTLPSWPGRPLVVVVLLEAKAPDLAIQIGQALLTEPIKSGPNSQP